MTWRPEDFDDLAGHLRRQVGGEFRDEAAEVERLTDLQRRRRQTLRDVAVKAMNSGYEATVVIGNRRWQGEVSGVGRDYLRLATAHVVVEAPLNEIMVILQAARSGGRSGQLAALTWQARLAELAMDEPQVTLVTPEGDLDGRIVVVAADHLEIEGGVYVSMKKVKAVLSSED